MAALGFCREDFGADDPDVLEVLECNLDAFYVFVLMRTQWRSGYNGRTGLDYSALREVWARLRIPLADRDSVFLDVRTMEMAALTQMREDEKQNG